METVLNIAVWVKCFMTNCKIVKSQYKYIYIYLSMKSFVFIFIEPIIMFVYSNL